MQSFTENDRKDQQLLSNGSEAKRSISPQKGQIKNNLEQNQRRMVPDEIGKKEASDLYSSEKDKTININFNEIEKKHSYNNDEKN